MKICESCGTDISDAEGFKYMTRDREVFDVCQDCKSDMVMLDDQYEFEFKDLKKPRTGILICG